MIKRENPPRPEIASWSPGPCGPARIYKNRPKGAKKGQRSCLACYPANQAGQKVPMTLGCSLVLCPQHRDPAFIASDCGRRFLTAHRPLYQSLGLSSGRSVPPSHLRRPLRRPPAPPVPPAPGRLLRLARTPPGRREGLESDGQLQQGLTLALATPPDLRVRTPSARTTRRWWLDRRGSARRSAPPSSRSCPAPPDRGHVTPTRRPSSAERNPPDERTAPCACSSSGRAVPSAVASSPS